MTRLLGVVLAGGAGRRFGQPKGEASLGGLPLVVRALRALAPSVDAVAVVGLPGAVPEGVPVRGDLRPGQGPLGGLETALTWAREQGREGVLALACDLPLVGSALPAELARRWRDLPGRAAACVLAGVGPARQPLCGVYGVDLLDHLSAHLDAGPGRSVHGWLERVETRSEIPLEALGAAAGEPPGAALLNVNRPEDRVRAELMLRAAPPVVSVVGWKDSGKTTVAVELVAALRERGLRVVAIKHGHRFRVDTPGTDSWRLRHEAGAVRVVLAGPEDHAVMGEWEPTGEPPLAELVRRYAGDADLVVAEGWKSGHEPAVEVRGGRAGADRPPLAAPDRAGSERFLAVVAAGSAAAGEPPRLDPDAPDLGARLADLVLAKLLPDLASTPSG